MHYTLHNIPEILEIHKDHDHTYMDSTGATNYECTVYELVKSGSTNQQILVALNEDRGFMTRRRTQQ